LIVSRRPIAAGISSKAQIKTGGWDQDDKPTSIPAQILAVRGPSLRLLRPGDRRPASPAHPETLSIETNSKPYRRVRPQFPFLARRCGYGQGA